MRHAPMPGARAGTPRGAQSCMAGWLRRAGIRERLRRLPKTDQRAAGASCCTSRFPSPRRGENRETGKGRKPPPYEPGDQVRWAPHASVLLGHHKGVQPLSLGVGHLASRGLELAVDHAMADDDEIREAARAVPGIVRVVPEQAEVPDEVPDVDLELVLAHRCRYRLATGRGSACRTASPFPGRRLGPSPGPGGNTVWS